jgi:hypothetical protein
MVYILTAELDAETVPGTAFARYQAYLAMVRERFPPQAFALATSRWYFDNTDHRAPHDAWLEEARLVEVSEPSHRAARRLDLHVRLLGAYHDGWIDLHYRDVTRYQLSHAVLPRTRPGQGHRDWRYDEFRLTTEGRVLHEIEWWDIGPTANWVIEAADVSHSWTPWPAEGTPPATA